MKKKEIATSADIHLSTFSRMVAFEPTSKRAACCDTSGSQWHGCPRLYSFNGPLSDAQAEIWYNHSSQQSVLDRGHQLRIYRIAVLKRLNLALVVALHVIIAVLLPLAAIASHALELSVGLAPACGPYG